MTFFREQFQILLIAVLFVTAFLFYYFNQDPAKSADLKDVTQGLLYALLAVFGLRPRPGSPADRMPSASTETGDISITQPPPADPAKEKSPK